jgi:hypothetical protein
VSILSFVRCSPIPCFNPSILETNLEGIFHRVTYCHNNLEIQQLVHTLETTYLTLLLTVNTVLTDNTTGTDVSEELSASIIRVTIRDELGTLAYQATDAHCLVFFHPYNGGTTFLRNVGSYKSHTG